MFYLVYTKLEVVHLDVVLLNKQVRKLKPNFALTGLHIQTTTTTKTTTTTTTMTTIYDRIFDNSMIFLRAFTTVIC